MSLKITRAGILDSIQDAGRHGYRHLGINPSGVMDLYSASLSNILAGNATHEAVIEFHFPASVVEFETPAIIVLCGADFSPVINDIPVPLNQPLWVNRHSVLHFQKPNRGARCYLAVHDGFIIQDWLGSASTHFKAGAGGWHGRKLIHGDIIPYMEKMMPVHFSDKAVTELFPEIEKSIPSAESTNMIKVLPGNEFSWMDSTSRERIQTEEFTISMQSDRMGYGLKGPVLQKKKQVELVSSPVSFGTIQLLPDGGLMILMADHQTSGGYPRVAQVISADHSTLAQMKPGDKFRFQFVELRTAETLWIHQKEWLSALQKSYYPKLLSLLEKKH